MKFAPIFILVICFIKLNKCLPFDSTVLTSKYAKVAVWGNNKTNRAPDIEEGRNNKDDRIWNHRLDPKSIGPNTKKKNSSVAYQYPVYQASDKKAYQGVEHVPGIGEVLVASAQDRFEARPLFAYKNKQIGTYGPPPAPKPKPPVVTTSPTRSPVAPLPPPSLSISSSSSAFSTFSNPPAPQPPISSSNSNENLYSSPFSSYSPPDFRPDGVNDDNLYPPNAPSNNRDNSAAQDSPIENQSTHTERTKANTSDSYSSLGPPLSSYSMDEDNQPDSGVSSYNNNDYHEQRLPHEPIIFNKNNNGPPNFSPKSIDDVYYPPDFPKEQVPHYGDHENLDDAIHQPQDSAKMPPNSMKNGGKASGNGNDLFMSPPSLPDYDHGHAFPHYLYDHHHYDHHVYEEIPHTTMAPAKEDKRVSSTHYSYYYLGRKLWYIPLYFSVYFIIYVTVLILKSIARHKVRLKYKWYEHDISAKQSRSMDFDAVRNEEITDIHKNVTVALHKATEKYNSLLAMK